MNQQPIDDGGCAYPCMSVDMTEMHSPGMSLRDYFAGQALAGDLACQAEFTGEYDNSCKQIYLEERAAFFYRFADAMLAARKGKQ